MGQNPAVGAPNARLERRALANLDWLVVRDMVETETATFWLDSPEVERGELRTEEIATEVFFFPAAGHAEKEGCFTNTQRLLQWRDKAVNPPGDARSEAWFVYHLGRRLKARAARDARSSQSRAECADVGLPHRRARTANQTSTPCCRRSTGVRRSTGDARRRLSQPGRRRQHRLRMLDLLRRLSLARPQPGARTRMRPARTATAGDSPGPRIAASSTTVPRQDRTARRGASARSSSGGTAWPSAGPDSTHRTSRATRRRTTFRRRAPPATPHSAAMPRSSCTTTGSAGSGCRTASRTARCRRTTSRFESPVSNRLYRQQVNPLRGSESAPDNAYAQSPGDPDYPYVLTTYRLTEHHTAGGMSRTLSHLAELQPELFCEISPALARDGRRRERRRGSACPRRAGPSRPARSSRRASSRSPCTAASSTRSACRIISAAAASFAATSSTTSSPSRKSRTSGSWKQRDYSVT